MQHFSFIFIFVDKKMLHKHVHNLNYFKQGKSPRENLWDSWSRFLQILCLSLNQTASMHWRELKSLCAILFTLAVQWQHSEGIPSSIASNATYYL